MLRNAYAYSWATSILGRQGHTCAAWDETAPPTFEAEARLLMPFAKLEIRESSAPAVARTSAGQPPERFGTMLASPVSVSRGECKIDWQMWWC
ncbi:hypothetical protein VTO73DRAFT_2479 [Trametes versicolor]